MWAVKVAGLSGTKEEISERKINNLVQQ